MPWIALTEADALTVVNAPILAAARTKALKAGQADPLVETIQQVVDLVHDSVGASGKFQLGPAGTIPSRLKATALDILAVRLLNRLEIEPEKAKLILYTSAETKLEAYARGVGAPEDPVEKNDEPVSTPVPRITPRTRTHRRADADGS